MLIDVCRSLRAAPMAVALCAFLGLGQISLASVVTGDLNGSGNSAITFDPLTPTPVIVRFYDFNLEDAEFYQLGFSTTNGSAFSVSNVMYSFDNVTYSGFDGGTLNVAGPSSTYSSIQPLGSAGVPATIFFSYTLPAGIDYDSITQVVMLANINGANQGGVLSNEIGSKYVSIVRTHTAISMPINPNVVPEPTTFAIAAIGLSLAGLRQMRRRSRSAI